MVDVRVPGSLPFGAPLRPLRFFGTPPSVLPAPLIHVRLDFLRVPRAALRLEPEHRVPPRSTRSTPLLPAIVVTDGVQEFHHLEICRIAFHREPILGSHQRFMQFL